MSSQDQRPPAQGVLGGSRRLLRVRRRLQRGPGRGTLREGVGGVQQEVLAVLGEALHVAEGPRFRQAATSGDARRLLARSASHALLQSSREADTRHCRGATGVARGKEKSFRVWSGQQVSDCIGSGLHVADARTPGATGDRLISAVIGVPGIGKSSVVVHCVARAAALSTRLFMDCPVGALFDVHGRAMWGSASLSN